MPEAIIALIVTAVSFFFPYAHHLWTDIQDSQQIHAALQEWKTGVQIRCLITEASHHETYRDHLGAMQLVRNLQRGESKYDHMLLMIYIQTMQVNFSNLQWNQKELTKLEGNTLTMKTRGALPPPQDQRD